MVTKVERTFVLGWFIFWIILFFPVAIWYYLSRKEGKSWFHKHPIWTVFIICVMIGGILSMFPENSSNNVSKSSGLELINENNPNAQQVTCNKPYILVGISCCLDNNDNAICDIDETVSQSNESLSQNEDICTPDWDCSSWSTCSSSGKQTRTCTDSNSCGISTGKPKESQSCTPPSQNLDYSLEMTTEQIFDEFRGLSDIQIDEKLKEFKGKRIKTSLVVSKIDKATLSSQYVAMEMYEYPYNLIPYVKAFFPAGEKDNLLKANIGDTITFSGEFVTYNKGGLTDGYIEFTESGLI